MRRHLIGLLAVLALVTTACNGGDSGAGVATLEDPSATTRGTADVAAAQTDGTIDTEAQMLAFAQCMRDAGVDMEDPTVDSNGNFGFGGFRGPGQGGDAAEGSGTAGPPEGFREAITACRPLLDGLELGFGQRDQTAFQDTLVQFAQCMRDNGYQMDDPDLSGFGPGGGDSGQPGGPFGNVDFNDPTFQKAQAACSDILGGFDPGGRPGPGGAEGPATGAGQNS